MADPLQRLREACGELPEELAAYFQRQADGGLSGHKGFEVNLLSADEAAKLTAEFREFHDVVVALQGVILDETDTSNYHAYLGEPACKGAVLYLNHDGASRIVFRNLDDFVAACEQAIESESDLRTYHPSVAVVLGSQAELKQLIIQLLDGGFPGDATTVLLCLIPSLNLADEELLRRLAQEDDFFIAEAVGDAIAQRPRRDLAEVAQLCASHSHPQAAAAGRRALAAIAVVS